jgi:ubiquinone/menaquinone biosynthesis C-methylase UbiE
LAFHAAGLRRLTGLDLSASLLAEARRRCTEAGCEGVETICADMREIPFRGTFAAIVSLFTSFGYFAEDAENARVLEAAHRALRPGGRLLLDLMNREWILSHLVSDEEKTMGDVSVRIRRSLDPSRQRVEKTMSYVAEGDAPRVIRESVRLFAADEITRMLIGAGFDEIRLYGSLAGEPWGLEPRRMVVVATRPKGAVSS